MIAGLEEITGGQLVIGDTVVNKVPPKSRDIAMVFQNYALYPHMTVRENMGFGLKIAKRDKKEIDERVTEAAKILDLENHLDRKPANLSGGQRQRVAMGRAIVRSPKAFLMDEPLSNLDAKLRVQMRAEVARIQQSVGTTTIYVTHDQTEAMTLGHRVAVMRGGVLQQVDTPKHLYEHPINLFVAGFIGSPAMNFVAARLEDNEIKLPFGSAPIPDHLRAALQRSRDTRDFIAGFRPEHFEDAHVAPDKQGLRFTAPVRLLESMGSEIYAFFATRGGQVDSSELAELAKDSGLDDVPSHGEQLITSRLSAESEARVGANVDLVLDTRRIMLFDPDDGRNLAAA
jgi:multiple sugar transport system ATP-binding protein